MISAYRFEANEKRVILYQINCKFYCDHDHVTMNFLLFSANSGQFSRNSRKKGLYTNLRETLIIDEM